MCHTTYVPVCYFFHFLLLLVVSCASQKPSGNRRDGIDFLNARDVPDRIDTMNKQGSIKEFKVLDKEQFLDLHSVKHRQDIDINTFSPDEKKRRTDCPIKDLQDIDTCSNEQNGPKYEHKELVPGNEKEPTGDFKDQTCSSVIVKDMDKYPTITELQTLSNTSFKSIIINATNNSSCVSSEATQSQIEPSSTLSNKLKSKSSVRKDINIFNEDFAAKDKNRDIPGTKSVLKQEPDDLEAKESQLKSESITGQKRTSSTSDAAVQTSTEVVQQKEGD